MNEGISGNHIQSEDENKCETLIPKGVGWILSFIFRRPSRCSNNKARVSAVLLFSDFLFAPDIS